MVSFNSSLRGKTISTSIYVQQMVATLPCRSKEDSGEVSLTPLALTTTGTAVNRRLDLRDFPDTASATDSPDNPENDVILGNSLDNTLTSNSGNDRLRGRAGQDTYILRRTDGAEPREVIIDNRADDLTTDLLYIETDAANLTNPVREGDDLVLSDGGAFARIELTDWVQGG